MNSTVVLYLFLGTHVHIFPSPSSQTFFGVISGKHSSVEFQDILLLKKGAKGRAEVT